MVRRSKRKSTAPVRRSKRQRNATLREAQIYGDDYGILPSD